MIKINIGEADGGRGRDRQQWGRARRRAAPAVEGLERRVSLSGFGSHSFGAVSGHRHASSADLEVGGGIYNPGILFNHNETLVRHRTPSRRRTGAKR